MAILDRFRDDSAPPRANRGESSRLTGTVPGPDGRSFMRVCLEMEQTPGADGEETRMRMHVSADFSALTALPAPSAPPPGRTGSGALAPARRWVAHRLASAPIQRALAPLAGKTFNTWIHLRTSTAPLDGGSRALVPGGIERLGLQLPDDGVPLHAWSQDSGNSHAQMTVINLDAQQLPPLLRRLLGSRFQLGGTIVNVVEPKRGD
ncbi:MAG: hypothetical protein K0U79_17840 [Gammaproteobacteria bacterium]|nr:hypothetical protein [Gammaproteobacteria bacterium]